MIERTFPIDGGAEIEVTFSIDPGDHSVGIGLGWGEDTSALVKAGSIWTFILFEPDYGTPVAEWKVTEIQTNYRDKDPSYFKHMCLTEPEDCKLSELPEIARAVEQTWEQVQAQEALDGAQERLQECQEQLAEAQSILRETGDGHHLVAAFRLQVQEATNTYTRLLGEFRGKYSEDVSETQH